MDFLEIASARQSTRAYDGARPVEREKLACCMEAARLAPSASNRQPYHLTIATGERAKKVGACTRGMGKNSFTREAPAFLVISEEPYTAAGAVEAKGEEQDYRAIDIGIAAAYFTAEANTQGLSTCILGWFDRNKLQELLQLSHTVRLVIAVGYARQGDPLRTKVRKPAEELATWTD